MNRLWIKLLAAFGVVILIGVIVTVLVARQAAVTQLSHFMVGNQMVRPAVLQQVVGNYYTENDGWDGIDAHLQTLVRSASDGGAMGGMMGGMMGMFDSRIRLVNDEDIVIADTDREGMTGHPLGTATRGARLPVSVDGIQIGTLVVDGARMTMPSMADTSLLTGLTRAVLTAALVAGLVALILAAFVVRQITRPVAELGNAARQIAAGDLSARVEIQSGDELGDLARAFNRMAVSLQEQEQLRRNLVADIAHELRTPLTGIQGTVEALQDGIFPLTAENLEPIHEQAILLNRLVDDLRTLALADAGELTLTVETVDLADLIARVLDSFRAQAHAGQVALQFDGCPSDRPLCIPGDRARLHQVATNLVGNALRHTPSGGTITVDLSAEASNIRWCVTDTGEGINPEDLPHVFERFYRADGSRSRMTGGSGLGLTIVKQIVTAHDGDITVTSPPSGAVSGAQFTITLPGR